MLVEYGFYSFSMIWLQTLYLSTDFKNNTKTFSLRRFFFFKYLHARTHIHPKQKKRMNKKKETK